MKKLILLTTLLAIVTAYVFFDIRKSEEKDVNGDPVFDYELEEYSFGKTVEEPINDVLTIGKIQTDYVLYNKGEITFEEHVENTMKNLEKVLNYPFNPLPNYLFSVGYREDQAVQFYFLGNKEETRTVIFRVQAGKKSNAVSVIYDGGYYKLVGVSRTTPYILEAYDKESNLTEIEVE